MVCLFPNFTVLFHSLRLFGHFPYSLMSEDKSKMGNSNSKLYPKYKTKSICRKNNLIFVSSRLWKIWSIGFCFLNTLLTIYSSVEENYLCQGRTFGIDTACAPCIIFDILHFICLFLMNLLSMKSSHKLCTILNKLHGFLLAKKIYVKKYQFLDFCWLAPYLSLIAVVGSLTVISHVQVSLFRDLYHICFYQFITALCVLLVSIYSSLFYGILNTVGFLYAVVFSDFTIYSKNLEEKYFNPPLQVYCNVRESEVFTTKYINCSNCWDKSGNSSVAEKKDNTPWKGITMDSIRKCKISLLQLFAYKRLIVDYFKVLIIIIMIELISSTTIPLFYISILSRSFIEILIPIFHCIPSIVSLIVLLNSTYKINQQVRL